jgi:hypothetical protein
MWEAIAIVSASVGAAGAVSAWIFAYRARGEALAARNDANTSAERARIAETKADESDARAFDSEARAVAAATELKAAEARIAVLLNQVDARRRENTELYERLAKAGAPVGGVLVDASLDRLYEDEDRGEAGRGTDPGTGGNGHDMSGDATPPSGTPKPSR